MTTNNSAVRLRINRMTNGFGLERFTARVNGTGDLENRAVSLVLPIQDGFPVDALLEQGIDRTIEVPVEFFDLSEEEQVRHIAEHAFD